MEKRMTPGKTIRAYCLWCCDGSSKEVKLCGATACQFYLFRRGEGRAKLSVIRKKCFECSGDKGRKSSISVRNCQFNGKNDELCPLWIYRNGKRGHFDKEGKKENPYPASGIKRQGNALALARYRASRTNKAIVAGGTAPCANAIKRQEV